MTEKLHGLGNWRPRRKRTPRDARSYHGARRNDARGSTWPGITPTLSMNWRVDRWRVDRFGRPTVPYSIPYHRWTREQVSKLIRRRARR